MMQIGFGSRSLTEAMGFGRCRNLAGLRQV